MRKLFFTLLVAFLANQAFADSILIESFEYANHDFDHGFAVIWKKTTTAFRIRATGMHFQTQTNHGCICHST